VRDSISPQALFRLNVTVPPGTTATVFLPGKAGVEVVAGAHSFEAALKRPIGCGMIVAVEPPRDSLTMVEEVFP
jgi:hypothetical protein